MGKLAQGLGLGSADMSTISGLPYRIADFEPMTYLVRQGDVAIHCGLVVSGFLCSSKIGGDGSRQIVSFHLNGDLFGFQSIFLDESDHHIQVLSHASIFLIPKQAVLDAFEGNCAFRQALLRNMLKDLSISKEWLFSMGRRSALARVAHLICELAVRQDVAGLGNGLDYDWPLTQEQFGDATGLTAVHVNRMIKALRDEGVILSSKNKIKISDWPRLAKIADFTRGYLHMSGDVKII